MNHVQVGLFILSSSPSLPHPIPDIEKKRSELAKALRCYRAVVELSSKIDPALVEESNRGIYQIEALQASHN